MLAFGLIILAYVLGSLPIGYLVGKHLRGIDIRQHGSGNIGTTNAFRIMGTGPGIVVLVGDLLKGMLPVLFSQYATGPNIALLAGIAAIAGHNWSLFLGFSGGRGVATAAGVIFALAPSVILVAFLIWVAVVGLSRYVSLGSIVAAISVPLLMIIFAKPWSYTFFGIIAALFIIIRHRPNILRLLKGTENRLGGHTK